MFLERSLVLRQAFSVVYAVESELKIATWVSYWEYGRCHKGYDIIDTHLKKNLSRSPNPGASENFQLSS